MKLAGLLSIITLFVVGCGSSSRTYSASEVKQAFTRSGLHNPKVQNSPPGTVFNYNRPPHVVSVSVFRMKIPVYFGHEPQMRVKHLGNVMVYYDVTESRVVARALRLLNG